jgi:glutamate dehydrogenase/leucine dehydrogenase
VTNTPGPAVTKLASTDAFVVVDLPGAPASGVVRRARKILHGSASDLARSATYTFGAFGVQRSGASAGINAEDSTAPEAIQAFVAEMVPIVASQDLQLEAGKGVEAAQLAELHQSVGAGPEVGSVDRLVAGVVAATGWALGGDLAGRSVAIEGHDQAPPPLRAALTDAGATVVDVWGVDEKPWLIWGADVDAIVAGSKPGALTHQGAPLVKAKAIVPWGPIPVTTKAFAQLRPTGCTIVPDFVSTAGLWLGDVSTRIIALLDEAASHPDGVLLGACYVAEAFIETWQERRPFGRPLAA